MQASAPIKFNNFYHTLTRWMIQLKHILKTNLYDAHLNCWLQNLLFAYFIPHDYNVRCNFTLVLQTAPAKFMKKRFQKSFET